MNLVTSPLITKIAGGLGPPGTGLFFITRHGKRYSVKRKHKRTILPPPDSIQHYMSICWAHLDNRWRTLTPSQHALWRERGRTYWRTPRSPIDQFRSCNLRRHAVAMPGLDTPPDKLLSHYRLLDSSYPDAQIPDGKSILVWYSGTTLNPAPFSPSLGSFPPPTTACNPWGPPPLSVIEDFEEGLDYYTTFGNPYVTDTPPFFHGTRALYPPASNAWPMWTTDITVGPPTVLTWRSYCTSTDSSYSFIFSVQHPFEYWSATAFGPTGYIYIEHNWLIQHQQSGLVLPTGSWITNSLTWHPSGEVEYSIPELDLSVSHADGPPAPGGIGWQSDASNPASLDYLTQ